jgi:hypothetical protein
MKNKSKQLQRALRERKNKRRTQSRLGEISLVRFHPSFNCDIGKPIIDGRD